MAKTNLLNTSTVSLGDLLGNGRIYRVPAFQRDYSWDVEQWEDLWNDILDLVKEPESRHYMGALVLEEKSEHNYFIIDGQQRMATLSILALAVIRRIEQIAAEGVDTDRNLQRAEELKKGFIGQRDPASLVTSSKLFLNENDDPLYQDYLVRLKEPRNPRGLRHSERLLWNCFQFYLRRVGNESSIRNDGEALATLLSKTVALRLLFISITVDDELNAYTVFETLNARGLELSSTDLLKNYLFSLVKVSADLDTLRRRWRAVIDTVRHERFPEFLRYHFLCEVPKVRSERLFKLVRDRIKNAAAALELIDELESRAELFAALGDSNHDFWVDERECKPFIVELNLFRVRQMTPMLFAAREKFSRADFCRTLKLASTIAFRYTTVSGLNTNELEPKYHLAAKSILDGEAKGPADVFRLLKDIYGDSERFEQDFARLEISSRGQRKKLVKYILCKIESDVSGRDINPETDSGTIEHILPENPTEVWESMIKPEHWDTAVYRLGNLTLLEAPKNRSVGNSEFAAKTQAYAESRYSMTARIAQDAPEDWGLPKIEERQEWMAKRAAHIWRSDFDTSSTD